MKKERFLALFLVLALILPISACVGEKKEPMTRSYFEYFDTVCAITSYADESEAEFEANCAMIEELFERYHKELDIYYEYSGVNNLKTVNRKAGREAVGVSRELMDFLIYAKGIHTLTGGKTNIAMGAVLTLWHDAREYAADDPEGAYIPSKEELEAAAEHTSIDALVLDEEKLTVSFSDPDLKLDVGALGKGYVASLAKKMLEEKGIGSYVLNVGGNIVAVGNKPDGSGWVTGITNPDKTSSDFAARVILRDTSCVTSGNYERFFDFEGKRYHHIIDPETLYPAEYFASVTVICEDSALADALSTALFCMSYEEGLALEKQFLGVDVLWVYENGEQRMTDGFLSIIKK